MFEIPTIQNFKLLIQLTTNWFKTSFSKRIKSAEDSKNFHFKIIKLKSKKNKNVTFDAADELSNLNTNGTATNGSDKKRTRPDFDIGNGTDTTVYGSGTKINELSIVSSAQSYRRSRKGIRPGFLQ